MSRSERLMNEVLTQAIKEFGQCNQKIKAIEEMSELIKEICKEKVGETKLKNIVDEIADVEIMIEQLKIIYDAIELVDERKKYKINRLKERIEKNKNWNKF